MGTANICKLFAASLLRHQDDVKTAVNLASNRLPAVIVTLLLSDAILDTTFYPAERRPCRSGELEHVLAQTCEGLASGSAFTYGVPIKQAQEEAARQRGAEGGPANWMEGSSGKGRHTPARPTSGPVLGWFSSTPKTRRAPLSYFEDDWEDCKDARPGAEADEARVQQPPAQARWSFDPFSWRLPRFASGVIGVQLPWEQREGDVRRSREASVPEEGGGEGQGAEPEIERESSTPSEGGVGGEGVFV